MEVQVTVKIGDREEHFTQVVDGAAAEREEVAHRLGKQVGRVVAEAALQEHASQQNKPHCCGHAMSLRDNRAVTLKGLDGELRVRRRRCRCQSCGREVMVGDDQRQCGLHRVTRPLAKRVCQLATTEHFTKMPQLLFDQHGVRMSHEEILELVHDVGTQANRLRLAEAEVWLASGRRTWPEAKFTPERIYISCDGIMYCTNQSEPDPQNPGQNRLIWQQMKVGCVYWQDARGDWKKQMTWGRESPEEFGASLYRLACECGYREAKEKVFAADGGEWCWGIQARYFSEADGILDWYHAKEHLWDTAKQLHPQDPAAATAWVEQATTRLHDQGGSGLSLWLKAQLGKFRGAKKRQSLDNLIRYVGLHLPWMHYPTYRARDWQVGTGMMESTCKQLVGLRLKGPGMHWSEAGALAITPLRAQSLNNNWTTFWNILVMNTRTTPNRRRHPTKGSGVHFINPFVPFEVKSSVAWPLRASFGVHHSLLEIDQSHSNKRQMIHLS